MVEKCKKVALKWAKQARLGRFFKEKSEGRPHNPEVVWFKSHPRNQKNAVALAAAIFLPVESWICAYALGYETDERGSLGLTGGRRRAE